MKTAEINASYILPYTYMAVAGKGGAFALLLVVFMCVTSTVSAKLIAVSSISSFDIYQTYINPHASDKQIVRVSRWWFIQLLMAVMSSPRLAGWLRVLR